MVTMVITRRRSLAIRGWQSNIWCLDKKTNVAVPQTRLSQKQQILGGLVSSRDGLI